MRRDDAWRACKLRVVFGWHALGGLGFRDELARKFELHAGIDVAHSPGTTAVYFQVGNVWFSA
ncbi:MAG: hypothetical protein JHC40_18730 [Burkholderiales bacterium]|nr:hypothetical protein [Burkholderiales bacterium]